MTLSSLHTISTHKKYRELLAEWAEDNARTGARESESARSPLKSGATVLVAFRTRPPMDGEVELFDAPLDDEDEDEQEEDAEPKPQRQPPPAPKIPAQRPPEEFMSGITAQRRGMVVHVPNMTWKGAGLLHKSYDADLIFGPEVDNDEVYEQTVKTPGLIELAMQGGVACVVAYGQTSAGKTYSMTALQLAIACDIFAPGLGIDEKFEVHVTFLEIMGNKARDLMCAENGTVEIRETGIVHPALQTKRVTNETELQEIIVQCLGHRRSAQTSRNAKSSRSHAIVNILLKSKLPGGLDGEIVLVDLAGSERHADSKKHSAERFQETRDNNKSLSALKDCVRARATGAPLIPFRTSKLTMFLKPMFNRQTTPSRPTRTVLLAHVSPHIQDAEHSANTLGYAESFKAMR